MKPQLLVIDDDPSISVAMRSLFTSAGFQVEAAATAAEAVERVRVDLTDVALLDLNLGGESGLELLPILKTLRPEMSVIVLTGVSSIETVVQAMKLGADNYVVKPLDPERLLALVQKVLEAQLRHASQRRERLRPANRMARSDDSVGMQSARTMAQTVAERSTTVLLLGETGSGKGVLARFIHEQSPRAAEPFVELNCAGLQRDLTESELFGYERGAFTGAVGRKVGLFEAADGGTLFLDEIGEMDLTVQAKLLQVLESRRFRRVGGTAEIEVDVRVIAATHRDLAAQVEAGRFRSDLLYRLNVFAIELPPLRERRDDILPLARQLLATYGGGELSPAAEQMLVSYHWPGNVRELRNVVERAAILCPQGQIVGTTHLPPLLPRVRTAAVAPERTLESAERRSIEIALATTGGCILAASRALGVSRGTLYRKIRKYGLTVED